MGFGSFSGGYGASGPGGGSGGSGYPHGGLGGPPRGGGGDPGDGYPGGRVPREWGPVPAARPPTVGALHLEAPPRYAGGAQRPGVCAWLREMSRWMRLMDYPEAKWIDIAATRTEGAASSWLSHEQLAIERRTRAPWADWEEFRQEMIRAFEPTTDETVAQ